MIDKDKLVDEHYRLVGTLNGLLWKARDAKITCFDKLFEVHEQTIKSVFQVDCVTLSSILNIMQTVYSALCEDTDLYLCSGKIVPVCSGLPKRPLNNTDITAILSIADKPMGYWFDDKAVRSRSVAIFSLLLNESELDLDYLESCMLI